MAASVLGLVILGARLNWASLQDQESVLTILGGVRTVYAWVVVAALLGIAQRYLTASRPMLTYLTEAIFPYYILHQTLIVMAGYGLTKLELPVAVEAGVIVVTTVLGCAAGYEIIRRVSLLRPLFGLPLSNQRRPAIGMVPANS